MKKFIKSGNTVKVVTIDEGTMLDVLPPAVYIIRYNDFAGYYIEKVQDSFIIETELYGSITTRSEKVIKAYEKAINSFGVLITGNKGMGKTELAKLTCNKLIAAGYAIIKVEEYFSGTAFTTFLQSLGEVVVLFDEFVKVFNNDPQNKSIDFVAQEQLLSFFDGTVQGKRMVLAIDNHADSVTHLFKNRPGRFWYHFNYTFLEPEVVKAYTKAQKLPKSMRKELVNMSATLQDFNMDVLKAVCREYNNFKLPLSEILPDLNVPSSNSCIRFIIKQISGDRFAEVPTTVVEIEETDDVIRLENILDKAQEDGLLIRDSNTLRSVRSPLSRAHYYDGYTLVFTIGDCNFHCVRAQTTNSTATSLEDVLKRF